MEVIIWMVIILGINFGALGYFLWRLLKKNSPPDN
jgi:H+/Cl- antiporter ClcA